MNAMNYLPLLHMHCAYFVTRSQRSVNSHAMVPGMQHREERGAVGIQATRDCGLWRLRAFVGVAHVRRVW